jgi:hypothetical protein
MIAAMTNSMLALCIAVLFTGWVWTLKHEVARLHGQLLLTGSGGGVHAHEAIAAVAQSHHVVRPSRVPVGSAVSHAQAPAKRRPDGVKVFVIEG